MEHLCTVLPDEDAMLLRLGARFQAAGLVQQAVDAFCKASSVHTISSAVRKTVHAQCRSRTAEHEVPSCRFCTGCRQIASLAR